MRLVRSLTDSPIESLSALILVGGGVYVSSIGSTAATHKTGLLFAGGVLTTFGGVLFSWVVSKAFATEQARTEFNKELGHLSRNLGQAAGQISRAVEQSQAEDVSSETGLALISQANRMIYGQVSEIAVIQGAQFDPAYLLETATTLDDLAKQLESDGGQGGELERVREQLQEVRKGLNAPTRTFSESPVACPSCNQTVSARLGDFPGDTAMVVCEHCRAAFNAHRGSDGGAFSRPIKTPDGFSADYWNFDCPSCHRAMSGRIRPGSKQMVCMSCYEALEVNFDARRVQSRGEKFLRQHAPIVGREGSRPLVRCPKCRKEINAFLPRGDAFIGLCHDDLQLMEVSRSEFETWKQEHSPQDEGSAVTSSLPVAQQN